jgi:hypothetical protein
MPHLRLEVPVEWLSPEFRAATGFDADQILSELIRSVALFRMPNPAGPEPPEVPLMNLSNLKSAIFPVLSAGVAGDSTKGFLHVTLSLGNDTPGRTAEVRRALAEELGNTVDALTFDVPNLASVTVHIKDIDRDRGYSTTPERRKKRGA